MLKRILIDVLCTGIALVIFALFHHVLPRQQQSVGIVIENPYKTTAPAEDDSGFVIGPAHFDFDYNPVVYGPPSMFP